MSTSEAESLPFRRRRPTDSRRWLQPRIPKQQLYRLIPRRPRVRLLQVRHFGDHARYLLRAWWLWGALAVLFWFTEIWPMAVAAAVISFVFYQTSPRYHPALYAAEPDFGAESAEFRGSIAGITGMPLVAGNRVRIYNNGDEFYPAMLEAVAAARSSVTMEQHIFWDGRVGRQFADAFAAKAREGLAVKLLVDAVGSAALGERILSTLEDSGCQLAWFHPIQWYTLDRANQRSHRKSLIVDGLVAFTGGAGLADQWQGSARNQHEWRDVQIRVEGPAALDQQTGFAQNWLIATGEILSGHAFFPAPNPAGPVRVQTILSSPSLGASAVFTMYVIALQCARKYIYIANPYFIPDSRLIGMLADARRRGATVKLMVAGRNNDTWWARQNSLRLYGKLLEAGVEIYEFQPAMLHQKTMIVDGVWATVGTANFDNRSLALNEETNICLDDAPLIEKLRRIFLADMDRCERVDLACWKRRGSWQRVKESLASLIEDQV